MIERRQQEFQIFLYRLRTSRQIDDQGVAPHHRNPTRKHCFRCNLHRAESQVLDDSRRVSLRHRQSCFRRDISLGKPGATGRQNQVGQFFIADPHKLRFEQGTIVR